MGQKRFRTTDLLVPSCHKRNTHHLK